MTARIFFGCDTDTHRQPKRGLGVSELVQCGVGVRDVVH